MHMIADSVLWCSDAPPVAFATPEDSATFQDLRSDGSVQHYRARVRVVVAELLPETCTSVLHPSHNLSVLNSRAS